MASRGRSYRAPLVAELETSYGLMGRLLRLFPIIKRPFSRSNRLAHFSNQRNTGNHILREPSMPIAAWWMLSYWRVSPGRPLTIVSAHARVSFWTYLAA